LLQGIKHQKEILLKNTLSFAENLPANNALLWGARGTGKSSLVKGCACRSFV
jgi:predicted AAA+ superfamily ATPase